jgi:putative redox protein
MNQGEDMTVEATLKWTEGWQFVGRAGDGPAIVIDSHDSGGGPSPMDLVLMGIAGCTAIDIVVVLEKKRIAFDAFEVHIRGERAEDHPKRYTAVHIEYVVTGKEVKPKAVERAIELSESKYCSAIASINAEVTSSYRILEPEPS